MDLIDRQLGRYRVISRLGAGGMGEAYRARDTRLERDVVLKVLAPGRVGDATARRLLQHEARSLSRLNHPAIAIVHDFDTVEDVDFVVMELIDGVPLSARIARGALPEAEAVAYAREMAAALETAHAAGVVHRDLKPGNVMITRANRVKVIDFGLARVLEAGPLDVTRSAIDALPFAGTVPYMSPEQLEARPLDGRSDVYALGVILHEMVTGVLPFRGSVLPRLIDAILHQRPPSARLANPSVSPGLDGLILRCLAKRAEERPQSARELAGALQRLAEGALASAPTTVAAPAVERAATMSLIALPARVAGAEADQFLSEAVPNTLTTELVRGGGIDMMAPPTTDEVERVGGDPARVAAAYDVSACLVATVTATPRRLTVNLQLVEPGTRRVRWAHEMKGTRRGYVAMLREAAGEIRAHLNLTRTPASSQSVSTSLSSELPLQRARYFANQFENRGRSGDFDRAVAAFGEVLRVEPASVPALEGLAVLHLSRIVFGVPPATVVPDAERFARQALEIDARAARAWSVLSELPLYEPSPDSGTRLEYALRGAALAPDDDFTQMRLFAALTPVSAYLAREACREMARLDPLVVTSRLQDAVSSALLGEVAHGLWSVDRALELEPDAPFARYIKTLLLIRAGREDEAADMADALEPLGAAGRLHPEWIRFARSLARGRADLAAGGERAVAFLSYVTEVACGKRPFPRWQATTSGVPLLLGRYGRVEEGLALLLARHAAGVREPFDLLMLHEDFAPFRQDPRFAALVRDASSGFSVLLDVMAAARTRGELPAYIDRALTSLLSQRLITAAVAR